MDLNTGGSFGELHCTCDLPVVFLIKLNHYLKYLKNLLQTVDRLCHQNVNLNTEYVPCQMFHATPMKKIKYLIPWGRNACLAKIMLHSTSVANCRFSNTSGDGGLR